MAWNPFEEAEGLIDRTVNTVTSVVSDPLSALAYNPIMDTTRDIVDQLAGRGTQDFVRRVLGQETSGDKRAREAREEQLRQDRERIQAYNVALGANDIDETTRQEIRDLFNSGASSAEIGRILGQAREGRGIYAVRRMQESRQKLMAQQPGRRQTVMSLGQGTVLGGGRGY